MPYVAYVESFEGWMDGAGAGASEPGGWNTGGQSTERLYDCLCIFFNGYICFT